MPASKDLAPGARRARVLVVDDDADIRVVLREALEADGYSVLEAADGAEGLAVLHDPDDVDVVLLDWLMPVLDGAGFAAGLRRLPDAVRQPPLIIVAATAARERAAQIGAVAAFAKPFLLSELLAAVATFSRGSTQAPGDPCAGAGGDNVRTD